MPRAGAICKAPRFGASSSGDDDTAEVTGTIRQMTPESIE
jgi:hypothetical protein